MLELLGISETVIFGFGAVLFTLVVLTVGILSYLEQNAQKKDREFVQWFEIQLGDQDKPQESVELAFVNNFSHMGRHGLKRKIFGSLGFKMYFLGMNKTVRIFLCVPNTRAIQIKKTIEALYPSSVCNKLDDNPVKDIVTMDGSSLALKARKQNAPFQPYSYKQLPILDQVIGLLKAEDEPTLLELSIYPEDRRLLKYKEKDMNLSDSLPSVEVGDYMSKGLASIGSELFGKYNPFIHESSGAIGSRKTTSSSQKELDKYLQGRESFAQLAFHVGIVLYGKGKNTNSRLGTIVTTFQGMNLVNGFKVVKKGKKLVSYIHSRKKYKSILSLMASSELANFLQIPNNNYRSWPLIKEVKKYEPPKAMLSDRGLRIGLCNSYGSFEEQIMRVKTESFLSHGFIEAAPGSGKTNLLGTMQVDLIGQQVLEEKGKLKAKSPREQVPGFTMFDPHSDCVEKVLTHLPPELYNRTHYIKMSEKDFPRAINVFDMESIDHENVADIFVKSLQDLYPAGNAVRMENFLKNGVLTLLKSKTEVTPLHIPLIFRNPEFRRAILQKVQKSDPFLMEFWHGSFAAEEGNIDKVLGPIWNRLNNLISYDIMRNMFGQTRTFINIRELMDRGNNLLIDAAGIGPDNMKLMATWLLIQYHFTALGRFNIPEQDRRGHVFFGDECHGWLSEIAAKIIDEDRKYGLGLWMATQYAEQIENKRLFNSILKNVGNYISLRSKPDNAIEAGKRLGIRSENIINLPDNEGYGTILVEEGFSKTPHLISFKNPYLKKGIYDPKPFKDYANERDGKPVKEVEKEMIKRYAVSNDEMESLVPSLQGKQGKKIKKFIEM
ncbi:hypothetical protein BHU72_14505 [Desulfuribacillus stibiiarsenatis]|uniref:TraD/TraG TraM recognition site domain-containing protein n=1 Tax=Desulfuribacillus stibiiarsenatis TaxID=1390249 RepID=A0A1E5L7B1_9FIRM|nr:hypothetical protein [Desulfuribacillus stibiiarsenatis]OEH86040.1 hypothetical protein BHU72_14505 [Desulfuribacillus stibiiarsenatis]